MHRRSLLLAAVVALLSFTLSPAAAQDQRCFPETGKCIAGAIRTYWEANGGLPVFGYPITALAVETNADGFTGPTQWFERDRLEDHTAEGKGVLAGRLGAQKLAMEGRPWETLPKVGGATTGCRFFPETGHSLCQPFLAYWESKGGLARFGLPISEPVTERNASGFTGNFQWFERRRMEAHPEFQPPNHILLGLLGNEVRSGANSPPPAPPAPQTPPPPAPTDPCANIAAPTDARITPNCVPYGQTLYVEVYGFDPNQQVGFWITHIESGDTIGTAQTVRVNAHGGLAGTIDTRNFGGYPLNPGNYIFVVRDAEPDSQGRIYPDSLAPFRVIGQGSTTPPPPPPPQNCDPSYPTVCIPPPPPNLNCSDIPYRNFPVRQPDPHGFDRDKDGIGCET